MEIPDQLITLERAAETERAKLAGLTGDEFEMQWQRWLEAAVAVQAAITEHAKAADVNRYELEMAVKKAVRHSDQDPAE